jgi:hypothetical protein
VLLFFSCCRWVSVKYTGFSVLDILFTNAIFLFFSLLVAKIGHADVSTLWFFLNHVGHFGGLVHEVVRTYIHLSSGWPNKQHFWYKDGLYGLFFNYEHFVGDDYFAWGSCCAEVEMAMGKLVVVLFGTSLENLTLFPNFFLPLGLIGGSVVLLRCCSVVRWIWRLSLLVLILHNEHDNWYYFTFFCWSRRFFCLLVVW